MRTMKRLALAVIVLGLARAPLAAAAPADTAGKTSASDPAYASDLRAYLDSLHFYEKAFQSVVLPSDPAEREFVQAWRASMTPDQFYAKALPVFARYIPPKQAATLGAMARKRPVPLGQQQAALQSYWAMEKNPQVRTDMREVGRELSIAFGQRMNERAIAEMRRAITELGEHRGTGYKVKVNRVGLSWLDRLTWLAVNNVVQQMNVYDTMEHACTASGLDTALRAQQLMAENGITRARQALDGCEQALELAEKSSESAFNQNRADMLALRLPPGADLGEKLDRSARNFYDFSVKYGEINRQLLEARRRFVSLIEARRATAHLDGDRILFESDEDVAEAHRDADEMAALSRTLNEFVYQQRQKSLLHDIDLHDGITAPQAPAAGPQ